MTDPGSAIAAAAVSKATTSFLGGLWRPLRQRAWKQRLARVAVKVTPVDQSRRQAKQLRGLIKRALAESPVVESLEKLDPLGLEETKTLLRSHLRDALRESCGDEWKPVLHQICKKVRDIYFEELKEPKRHRLTHEASQTINDLDPTVTQPCLPWLVTEMLDELASSQADVANNLRAWMRDLGNRRSSAVTKLLENPEGNMPLLDNASYLAW